MLRRNFIGLVVGAVAGAAVGKRMVATEPDIIYIDGARIHPRFYKYTQERLREFSRITSTANDYSQHPRGLSFILDQDNRILQGITRKG